VNIALIPARAGSKRIKHKNIKLFNGKPLIAYSIDIALKSGLFDSVVVSTDCPNIAMISEELGATVPFIRPDELSGDRTTTREVISHAIETLQIQKYQIDYCCSIYPTAPFVQVADLQHGLRLLKTNPDKKFALSLTTFDFPVQHSLKSGSDGLDPMFPEFIMSRPQDLEEAYYDAKQFYWGKAKDFLTRKAMYSKHSLGVSVPKHLVHEIAEPKDWLKAELSYKAYL
jgi:N-acylneuraminate cytidylyltransferase